MKKAQKKAGYKQVISPHIGNKELYMTSGHYQKYGESSFQPITTPADGEEFLLKPMNCPHHCEMYNAREDKPEDLKLLIEESKKLDHQSSVNASCWTKACYFFKQLNVKLYKFIFKKFTGKKINFGNFSCVPKIFLEDIVNTPLVDFHYSAAIIKSKNKYKSVPCNKGKRYTGKSKMSFFNLFFHGMKSLSIFRREIFIRFLFYYLIVNCIFLFSIEANMIIKLNFVILSFFSIFFLYLNTSSSKRFNKNDLIKNLNHNRLIKDSYHVILIKNLLFIEFIW